MRSISDLIIKTTPHGADEPQSSGPVACAVFIAVLAIAIAGGAFWLGDSFISNNAQAASLAMGYE